MAKTVFLKVRDGVSTQLSQAFVAAKKVPLAPPPGTLMFRGVPDTAGLLRRKTLREEAAAELAAARMAKSRIVAVPSRIVSGVPSRKLFAPPPPLIGPSLIKLGRPQQIRVPLPGLIPRNQDRVLRFDDPRTPTLVRKRREPPQAPPVKLPKNSIPTKQKLKSSDVVGAPGRSDMNFTNRLKNVVPGQEQRNKNLFVFFAIAGAALLFVQSRS